MATNCLSYEMDQLPKEKEKQSCDNVIQPTIKTNNTIHAKASCSIKIIKKSQ